MWFIYTVGVFYLPYGIQILAAVASELRRFAAKQVN